MTSLQYNPQDKSIGVNTGGTYTYLDTLASKVGVTMPQALETLDSLSGSYIADRLSDELSDFIEGELRDYWGKPDVASRDDVIHISIAGSALAFENPAKRDAAAAELACMYDSSFVQLMPNKNAEYDLTPFIAGSPFDEDAASRDWFSAYVSVSGTPQVSDPFSHIIETKGSDVEFRASRLAAHVLGHALPGSYIILRFVHPFSSAHPEAIPCQTLVLAAGPNGLVSCIYETGPIFGVKRERMREIDAAYVAFLTSPPIFPTPIALECANALHAALSDRMRYAASPISASSAFGSLRSLMDDESVAYLDVRNDQMLQISFDGTIELSYLAIDISALGLDGIEQLVAQIDDGTIATTMHATLTVDELAKLIVDACDRQNPERPTFSRAIPSSISLAQVLSKRPSVPFFDAFDKDKPYFEGE